MVNILVKISLIFKSIRKNPMAQN